MVEKSTPAPDAPPCKHSRLVDGVCKKCGLILNTDMDEDFFSFKKKKSSSIKNELEPLELPYNTGNQIKERAEEIYQRNCICSRAKQRKFLLFYCVYNAYDELGIKIDPKHLSTIFGLKAGNLPKASTVFSDQTTIKYTQPEELINELIERLGERTDPRIRLKKKEIKQVKRMMKEILDRDPLLREEFPQETAAGILGYYLSISSHKIIKKTYADIMCYSSVTISKIFKRAEKAYNEC